MDFKTVRILRESLIHNRWWLRWLSSERVWNLRWSRKSYTEKRTLEQQTNPVPSEPFRTILPSPCFYIISTRRGCSMLTWSSPRCMAMEQLLYHLNVDHDDKRTLQPRSAVQPILFLSPSLTSAETRYCRYCPTRTIKYLPWGHTTREGDTCGKGRQFNNVVMINIYARFNREWAYTQIHITVRSESLRYLSRIEGCVRRPGPKPIC